MIDWVGLRYLKLGSERSVKTLQKKQEAFPDGSERESTVEVLYMQYKIAQAGFRPISFSLHIQMEEWLS